MKFVIKRYHYYNSNAFYENNKQGTMRNAIITPGVDTTTTQR